MFTLGGGTVGIASAGFLMTLTTTWPPTISSGLAAPGGPDDGEQQEDGQDDAHIPPMQEAAHC